MKLKTGDRVAWKEHPIVISTIIGTVRYRNGMKRERYYVLKNGQRLAENEIIKL